MARYGFLLLVAAAALAASSAAALDGFDADLGNLTSTARRSLAQSGRPIPIDMSAVLIAQTDIDGPNSPCVKMVDRIKSYGGRAVNFFITAYYADRDK